MIKIQTRLKIRTLRTNNGGEYTSQDFNNFCTKTCIFHQLTIPYSPQQNGESERKNITVMEMLDV